MEKLEDRKRKRMKRRTIDQKPGNGRGKKGEKKRRRRRGDKKKRRRKRKRDGNTLP